MGSREGSRGGGKVTVREGCQSGPQGQGQSDTVVVGGTERARDDSEVAAQKIRRCELKGFFEQPDAAVRNGHEVVVRLLLEKGVDPDAQDTFYGRTPFWWAAQSGLESVVRLLLEKGVDPDSKFHDGRTPLSLAVENEHEAVVKLLQLRSNSA